MKILWASMSRASMIVVLLLLTAGLAAYECHAAETTTVTALPLARGYYVASDTPCSEASNATVSLLQREGIGGSRDFCEFKKIENTGPNAYRVTQACKAFQDSTPPETSVVIYTLAGDTRFTSRNEDGREYDARHCAQASMPSEWRENDIGDATD